ncbi:MAG: hypothetical protein HY814_01770 [Candidatus Riflebacteria bacterium]|nr:hypothetical protein [Candidatus Riflebacteria bacterium]
MHDLRSPLVTIESMSGLLKEALGDRLKPEERVYLQHVEGAALLMRSLLGDLTELTLIPTRVADPTPVGLREVVDQVLLELGSAIARAKAQVQVEGELPTVPGNRVLLQQLLGHLLENAVKFHQHDALPRVVLSSRLLEDAAEISISDNGIGIPAESRERVFGVFVRLHPRSRFEGNGIGLAVARRCVESHGGRIWLESEPDQGTTARFTLPLG